MTEQLFSKSQTAQSEPRHRQELFRNSVAITLVTICNLGLSFLTQMALASHFGTRVEMDSYLAALTLPTLGHDILVGAFNFTLVPLLVELQISSDEQVNWRILSHLFNAAMLLLGILGILGILYSALVMGLINPGFRGNELVLAVDLFHITWPAFVFLGLADLLTSFCYARHQFILAVTAQVVNVAIGLLSVVAFTSGFGIRVRRLGDPDRCDRAVCAPSLLPRAGRSLLLPN